MIVNGGLWKSSMAVVSRMNSGFMHTPKSLPACFEDFFSKSGITMFSTVPGSTVLRMVITWYVFESFNNSPMRSTTRVKYFNPKLPFSLLGVPTQTMTTSPKSFGSVVQRNFPVPTPALMILVSPGSMIGLCARLIMSTLLASTSTPVTSWPRFEKHAAVTQPTYPIPKIVTFITLSFCKRLGGFSVELWGTHSREISMLYHVCTYGAHQKHHRDRQVHPTPRITSNAPHLTSKTCQDQRHRVSIALGNGPKHLRRSSTWESEN